MPRPTLNFRITTENKQHTLNFQDVTYLGNGVYTCEVEVNSNGFMCKRIFGFDNDEYFLSKLKALLKNNNDDATLMAMQADSFIRFKSISTHTILVTGYIVEQGAVTHSIEFAFQTDKDTITTFSTHFEKMVRENI